ncbi:helix-turn-helix domain-containing protein [Crossiella sp. SN42]|uniref:helix-turn-helix domain-containing protein n=1 Tax=Crossiella sp. SN42 TaxID=2944808 RepID=UPI00207D6F35|nr:helix-turn-helix transcriptional regulator [Crossiella sp. SN42]MCO1580474.1 helix-turn-helix domain-containing protein [Crossiella sp. SN42]
MAADPLDPDLPVGRRIQFFRVHMGLSRPVVAERLGKSVSWLKAVETGRLLPPRLPVLVQLSGILGVRDLADLTGVLEPRTVDVLSTSAHPALPAVWSALNSYGLTGADCPPPSLAHLRERLVFAWQARHAAANHRTVLGDLLPGLLRDAQTAVRGYHGPDRARAQALLAEALNLATFYLAYQPSASLLWRAKERAMAAAQDSGHPDAIAMAAWSLAYAHRDSGDWDEAQAVTLDALTMLEPLLPDGSTRLLALYGALQFEAAFTAARAGRAGTAMHHLDEADRAAQRLPEGLYQPMTSFSTPIMTAHAVTVSVELCRGGEALRHAGQLDAAAIPSLPRRSRHQIEIARAHLLHKDLETALELVGAAADTAIETVRYNGHARQIVLEARNGPVRLRPRAEQLAYRLGLVA